MADVLNGADYRVKARHPRRDSPLVVTDAAGKVIATAGETCEACSQDQLMSMLSNGYIEPVNDALRVEAAPVPPVPVKPRRRTTDGER